jgi:hypothetical protein
MHLVTLLGGLTQICLALLCVYALRSLKQPAQHSRVPRFAWAVIIPAIATILASWQVESPDNTVGRLRGDDG